MEILSMLTHFEITGQINKIDDGAKDLNLLFIRCPDGEETLFHWPRIISGNGLNGSIGCSCLCVATH